jgi:hypothetical protein
MEIWKPIPKFEMYSVSNYGRVKSTKPRKGARANVNNGILKPCIQLCNGGNYSRLNITLRKNGKSHHHRVHTLVLLAFVGEPPKNHICRHLDGNPLNNHIDNLTWGTRKENHDDSIRHGTNKNPPKHLGQAHHKASYSDEIVASVRGRAFKRGEIKALAKELGVHPITITRWRDSKEGIRYSR